jgi:stress-induced morphogen
MIPSDEIKTRVLQALPDAVIVLKDLTGGGDHYQLEVRSAAFEGLSTLKRHKLVYSALQESLHAGSLHALALNTKTHSEP